jgi:hypothetical protein
LYAKEFRGKSAYGGQLIMKNPAFTGRNRHMGEVTKVTALLTTISDQVCHNRTDLCSAIQYNTVQYYMIQDNTIQYTADYNVCMTSTINTFFFLLCFTFFIIVLNLSIFCICYVPVLYLFCIDSVSAMCVCSMYVLSRFCSVSVLFCSVSILFCASQEILAVINPPEEERDRSALISGKTTHLSPLIMRTILSTLSLYYVLSPLRNFFFLSIYVL